MSFRNSVVVVDLVVEGVVVGVLLVGGVALVDMGVYHESFRFIFYFL